MKRTLRIDIECGETTCTSEPGRWCKYFGTARFGQIPMCMLFAADKPSYKQNQAATELRAKDGWTQRCQACLEAEGQHTESHQDDSDE